MAGSYDRFFGERQRERERERAEWIFIEGRKRRGTFESLEWIQRHV